MSDENKIVLSITPGVEDENVPIGVQLETVGDAVNGHDAFVAMFAGMGIISEEVIKASMSKYFPDLDEQTKDDWFAALVLPIAESLGANFASINETLNMLMDVIARGEVETVNGLIDAIMTGYDVEVVDDDGESDTEG
jgi:hypothetical protein